MLRRALLVEDEAMIAMLAEDILASTGCDVVVSAAGRDAIALIEQGPAFAVAVVDLSLPDIGGDAVIRALWARSPVPVIVSTGYNALPEAMQRELAAFPPAPLLLLTKPWDEKELRAAVRDFLAIATVSFERS